MFQEAIDDADHGNVFAQSRYAGSQATNAANVQTHGDTSLRSRVEGFDQGWSTSELSLMTIRARLPCCFALGFAIDQRKKFFAQTDGRGVDQAIGLGLAVAVTALRNALASLLVHHCRSGS